LELHRLQCFQIVVEEGGFKRATTRLHITQPALSYQIRQLEEELGAQLLYRRPGGIVPTEAGRLLLHYAQLINAAVFQAERAVRDVAEEVVGEIRIGTVNSIGTHFLPEVLWKVREHYPSVRPHILYRDSGVILDALLANELDLAIVANPRADKRLQYEKLLDEHVCLVCSRGHPLFGQRSVQPSDLHGLQFVSLSPDTPTGSRIRAYLEQLGIYVEPEVWSDNIETIKRMVEAGMAVAFLPEMVVREDLATAKRPRGRLSRSELEPPLTRSIVLVTWQNVQPSRAVSRFIDELREASRRWPASEPALARQHAAKP
jgi:DNA-binding transcriptional LysR family regulator